MLLREAWLILALQIKRRFVVASIEKAKHRDTIKGNKGNCGFHQRAINFLKIYEVELNEGRVVMFQIPPANPGISTTRNGADYAREGESTYPIPINKMDIIRSQILWPKQATTGGFCL